jgi:hypothetical protein
MMTMAGSGCLIDHAETLIAIYRSICEPTEAAFSASPPLVVNQLARVVNPMPRFFGLRDKSALLERVILLAQPFLHGRGQLRMHQRACAVR